MRLPLRNAANGQNSTRTVFVLRACRLVLFAAMFAVATSLAQSPSPAPQSAAAATPQEPASNLPELTTREESQTFQVKVNLVEVRVVVRDANGNAVGNLKQEDFVVLDNKVPQTVTRFSVERRAASVLPGTTAQNPPAPAVAATGEARIEAVQNPHLVLLFDDVNVTADDLVHARNAAEQRVKALQPGESVAVFTISGQGNQDFTSDPEKLLAALRQLKPRPSGGAGLTDCPPIDYYIANQIITNHDAQALQMVMQEISACQFDGNQAVAVTIVQAAANDAANRVLQTGDYNLQLTFHSLSDIVRRVSALPGQRNIVILSPGFIVERQQPALLEVLDHAIRSGVVINTLDVKGLYTQSVAGTDISQRTSGAAVVGSEMLRYSAQSASAQADPLKEIANATGGSYFHNRNDIDAGLAKLSAPPEYSYLLGFAPQNLKNDGKYHVLKVELKQPAGLTLQSRKGYYAPAPGGSDHDAQREIADAVFSQDELHELPMQVQTQFFKSGDTTAHLSVLVHVDVQQMRFRKSAGRNLNDLTVVAAIFDRNANFISAKSKTVQMHIRDETLTAKLTSGITLKSEFDVDSGSYMVRVVARDEQGKLTTQNSVVDIP